MVNNLLPHVIILICILSLSSCVLLRITGERKDYCFKKILISEDVVKINYIVSSQRPESIKCVFKNLDTNEVLFSREKEQSGDYVSDIPLVIGDYSLCFTPTDSNSYYLSFDMYSQFETGGINDLAKDKEVKEMFQGITDIRNIFQEIEKNLKQTNDRKYRHITMLKEIITSIKGLTVLKVVIIALLSIFQVFIIQKFFGPDKRVGNIKGAFSDGL